MSSDSALVYSTCSSDEIHQPVSFGVTLRNERSGRVEIHFTTPVHVKDVLGRSIETMFYNSPYVGVMSVGGDAGDVSIKVVETLAKFVIDPFDELKGIRLAESYMDDVYASCAVVRLHSSAQMFDMLEELGVAINGHYGTAAVTHIDSYGRESRQERQALLDYSCRDY